MAKLGAITATLENLSEEGALGATESALKAAETGVDVAEGNVEILKGEAEIDGMDTGIEDAFEAEGKIENLLEAAEKTLAEGGMSDDEAKLMEITHESIMSSIGMSHRHTSMSSSPVSSMESYASPKTRRSATILTIESLGDSAKSVVKNIIAALKAALNVVISFITGLLRNRALMEKHIGNLITQAKKIDTTKQKKRQESFSTSAGALSVGGSASIATAKEVLTGASELVAGSLLLSSSIGAVKDPESAVEDVLRVFTGTIHATNGRTLKVAKKDDGVSITFEEGKKADKIAAPSKDEIVTLLEQAKRVIADMRAVEKSQSKLKSLVDTITARLGEVKDTVRSKFGDEANKAKFSEAAKVKKNARLAKSIMTKAGGSLPGAAFAAVKAVVDYAAAGIRNYRDGEGSVEKATAGPDAASKPAPKAPGTSLATR